MTAKYSHRFDFNFVNSKNSFEKTLNDFNRKISFILSSKADALNGIYNSQNYTLDETLNDFDYSLSNYTKSRLKLLISYRFYL